MNKIDDKKWISNIFYIGLFILGIVLIFTSGNTPRADEWDTPGDYLVAKANGKANFSDLFRQHNESRVIFAQIFTELIARLIGWNQHFFHFLNYCLLALTAYIFLHLTFKKFETKMSFSALLVLSGAVLVLLSPVQWRNILYSGQIITIVIPFLLTLGIYINFSEKFSLTSKYFLASILSLVSTYSFANGMLLWILLWPGMYGMVSYGRFKLCRKEILLSFLFISFFIFNCLIYYYDYKSPDNHPSLQAGLKKPWQVLVFFSTWLGSPIFPEHVHLWLKQKNKLPFVWCGRFSFLAAIFLIFYFFNNIKYLWNSRLLIKIFPFLILVSYSFISGLAITIARVGFGMFGNSSRYATVAIPFYLGIAGIISCVNMEKKHENWIEKGLAFFFTIAVLLSFSTGVISCVIDKNDSDQAALSLQFIELNSKNPLLQNIHPNVSHLCKVRHELISKKILSRPESLEWVNTTEIITNKNSTFTFSIKDTELEIVIKGLVASGELTFGHKDFLILSSSEKIQEGIPILAPTKFNYPHLPKGSFEIRINKGAPFKIPEKFNLFIVKPELKQILLLNG